MTYGDQYVWPTDRLPDIRDGLTATDVADALYAPASLRMDNRIPRKAPTMLAVCAPIERDQRLIVVTCFRESTDQPWTSTSRGTPAPPSGRCGGSKHHEQTSREARVDVARRGGAMGR